MLAAAAHLCLVAALLQAPTALCEGHSAAHPHAALVAQRCPGPGAPGRPALGLSGAGQLRGGSGDGSGVQTASREELAMVSMRFVLRAE